MKVLPCTTCGKPAQLRDGTPYYISSFPDRKLGTYKYTCARCKRANTLTAVVFNKLPEVTPPEKAS